jgi:type II secretory pathway pseudopilin PulG
MRGLGGGVPRAGLRLGARDDDGASMVEVLVAAALIVSLTSLALPATAHSVDASRAREASGFIAARMRLARQLAVVRAASTGLVFDRIEGRWVMRVCIDGNGNGLRRAEIGSGVDACPDGTHDLLTMFPGVDVAVDPGLRGPDGEPGSADAVRFGASDIASFSPEGSATAGTVFLRSDRGRQLAVRVGNVTGRTRILRYDTGGRSWRPA